MRNLQRLLALALFTLAGAALASLPARAAPTIIGCPLPQATRTIVEPLAPGWSTASTVSGVTDYKVDISGGQPVLSCSYGPSGTVQRPVPINQSCTKIPGARFACVPAAPPGPAIVSDGPLSLADGNVADLDAGGPPDIRLRADNPFLRTFEPMSGARLAPQGTHVPSFSDCQSAPYSPAPILQTQLPVGTWLCINTSDGNFGRIQVVNINGIPGLPLPMTLYLNHTTWSGSGGGGGGGGQPVHSQATVAIPQTYLIDLDNGQLTTSNNADLWFQAVNVGQLYLKPMNGAQLAVGDKSDRGYNGCSAESYSTASVPLITLPPGSFVCAATGDGRVSEFKVISISGFPKTLTIAYTTWE